MVVRTMKTNAAAGSKAKAYASVYKFVDPNKRFEFTVPFGWVHEIIPETHGAIDSFYTPDGLSFINNITHDDGTTLSKSDAHSTALALTKSFYKITDLKVTGDKPQSEGSERLTWNSASQGIMGETIFVTRGTTFLVLIWVVDNAHYDTFKPVWASVAASYQVPQP